MLPTLISIIITVASSNQVNLSSNSVPRTLASRVMPMSNRYAVPSVNDVFKDNILLNMRYMEGSVTSRSNVNWDKVRENMHYEFTLKEGERFAFHDKIDKKYLENVVKTTNASFNYDDGFKSDGYLMGDGVCHLASIINWVAKDAGLDSYAPKNHDFARIPDVPKEYGVSIYKSPTAGEMNNLYITNNLDNPVTFVFHYENDNLTVSVRE